MLHLLTQNKTCGYSKLFHIITSVVTTSDIKCHTKKRQNSVVRCLPADNDDNGDNNDHSDNDNANNKKQFITHFSSVK